MAKASNRARDARNGLRKQARTLVRSSQHIKRKLAAKPIHADFSHLQKLNALDKESAAEISQKYDKPDGQITHPELLQQIQSLADSAEELGTVLDTLAEDFKGMKKNG